MAGTLTALPTVASPASAAVLDLRSNTAMRVVGARTNAFGASVASAGDVNGDGNADLLVGAPDYLRDRGAGGGAAYVVFLKAARDPVDVALLAPAQGYAVRGAANGDRVGQAVASVGDVNGDGVPDALIGAPGANFAGRDAGSAYVIYGQRAPTSTTVGLSALRPEQGFRIDGPRKDAQFGASVASVGDVDGDGIPDLLIGADGFHDAASYVIFGGASSQSGLRIADLRPSQGYAIKGAGDSVAAAGDVNGDGAPDQLVGGGDLDAAVVFGQRTRSPVRIDATKLTPSQGYAVTDAEIGGEMWSWTEVHSVGDVNGDGVPDMLTSGGGDVYDFNSGAWIIYGQRAPTSAVVNLGWDGPAPAQGYRIVNPPGQMNEQNVPGHSSLESVGDVNGDGVPDVLFDANAGLSVVYGQRPAKRATVDLSALALSAGYRINGGPLTVAPLGDVTADGVPDALLGNSYGEAFVLALRQAGPSWPSAKLSVVPALTAKRCLRPHARAVATVTGPQDAIISTQAKRDGRPVRTTNARTFSVNLPNSRRPAKRHVVALISTAADGTYATAKLQYRTCH